ncbi:MAG: hypothetical protein ACOZAJ_00080 [Patescibacteria group bacterium]
MSHEISNPEQEQQELRLKLENADYFNRDWPKIEPPFPSYAIDSHNWLLFKRGILNTAHISQTIENRKKDWQRFGVSALQQKNSFIDSLMIKKEFMGEDKFLSADFIQKVEQLNFEPEKQASFIRGYASFRDNNSTIISYLNNLRQGEVINTIPVEELSSMVEGLLDRALEDRAVMPETLRMVINQVKEVGEKILHQNLFINSQNQIEKYMEKVKAMEKKDLQFSANVFTLSKELSPEG